MPVYWKLGGTGDSYQRIYEQVETLARQSGLTEAGWHTDSLGRSDADDEAARAIKDAQHRVYLYLEKLVGAKALNRSNAWPDY